MTDPPSIRIRRATLADESFLLDLIPRLRAFGPGPLRPPEAMDGAEQDAVRRALRSPSAETVLLVAEMMNGASEASRAPGGAMPAADGPTPAPSGAMPAAGGPGRSQIRAGLAMGETHTDYFTGERHGHLGILAVAEAAEGKGVGQSLMAAVEEWALNRGYRFLTLNVFDGNHRAKAVYSRAGYKPDAIKYLKVLDDSGGTDDL